MSAARRASGLLVAALLATSVLAALPIGAEGVVRDKDATGTWTHAFCDGGADWIGALTTQAGAIPGKVGAPPDTAKVKRVLVGFFKAAVRSTKRFETRLHRAGPPDVLGGEKIAHAITNGLGTTRRAFKHAKSDAAHLTTTDTDLQAGLDAARTTLAEALAKVATTVDRVLGKNGSQEFGDALRADDTCEQFLPPPE